MSATQFSQYKSLLPQSFLKSIDDIGKLLVIFSIGMVRPDIRYDMVGGIYAQLAQVVELSGLAGFYADACIGVRRAVVRLIAGVLAPLVARTGTLVLLLGPFLGARGDRVQLFLGGRDTLLFFGGLVVLGPSYRSFFLSMALICRTLCKWASRYSLGTLSSRLSIEALALTGAESIACV